MDFSTKSAAPSSRARAASPISSNPVNITTRGLRAEGKDGGQRLDAVHGGHRRVEKQQLGLVAMGEADRLVAVPTLADDLEQPGQLKPSADERSDLRRVVDEDDRQPRATTGDTVHSRTVPTCRRLMLAVGDAW